MSLYQELGGQDAIDAAVDLFYQKVLADPRINHFFDGVDMQKQRAHQKRFLAVAFGGQADYAGRGMAEAHRRLVDELGLDDAHFDAVVEDLASALSELGVDADTIAHVAAVAESVRAPILGRA